MCELGRRRRWQTWKFLTQNQQQHLKVHFPDDTRVKIIFIICFVAAKWARELSDSHKLMLLLWRLKEWKFWGTKLNGWWWREGSTVKNLWSIFISYRIIENFHQCPANSLENLKSWREREPTEKYQKLESLQNLNTVLSLWTWQQNRRNFILWWFLSAEWNVCVSQYRLHISLRFYTFATM